MVNCLLCGKVLDSSELVVCSSCFVFIVWKYGSLENFENFRKEEVIKK